MKSITLVKWIVPAGLVVALAAGWFALAHRRPADPSAVLRRAWAAQGTDHPNVLLITLDTTRADHLGSYGDAEARTPVTDALARDGVLFTQAATAAPLTLPAHSSIMTGLYPTYHGVRLNGTTALGQQQTTMAEMFARAGYKTGAFVGAFVLDGRWGLTQGFDTYDDQFDLKKFKHLDLAAVQRPANEVVDAALRWLNNSKDAPFFAWVHLYDAHSPYEPPEPFLSEFRSRGLPGLYDGEIAFADQQVGRLLSWLRESGLDRKTLIVVVGDHGEALGSHGEGTHGYYIYDYAVHVPFIVAAPIDGLRGVRVESQVSLVDVLPTVLALTGLQAPAVVHGRSLVPLMFGGSDGDAETYAYSESMSPGLQYGWSELHSLRSPRFEFIQAPRPELYDLQTDRDEATNIIGQQPAVARRMGDALKRLMADTSRGAPAPEAANLDEETQARLASLGYVGGGGNPDRTQNDSHPRADPKDKLTVFTAVQEAGELMVKDDYARAATALESALREEPSMPQALLMLGSCYTELGRTKEAAAQFDRVLKDDPRSVQGLLGMATVLMTEGRSDDVVTLCKRTLSLDERNSQAYALLGDVYIDRQQPAAALPHLEKAVEIQPKLTQNRLNLAACLIDVHDLPRAEALLSEIVSAHPRFPGAQFNLGVLYEEQQRPDEARRAYAAEIANYPNSFKAHFNLGKTLSATGDWAGSVEQMREVMRIAPERPEGYLFAARALLQQSASLDEVQRLAQEGLGRAKTSELQALGWFLMADVYNRRREPDKVNEALRQARAHAAAGRERSQ
jgi:arylsulfatase A-like enzyme/Tfp pilus assembly protein PilF